MRLAIAVFSILFLLAGIVHADWEPLKIVEYKKSKKCDVPNGLYVTVRSTEDRYIGSLLHSSHDALEVWWANEEDKVICGSDYKDYLGGTVGDEVLYGFKGDDTLRGAKGDDILHGGKGDDELVGGDGNDILYGGNGSDSLLGGEGGDTFYGGEGDDTLKGSEGDDMLHGGEGDDTLRGSEGDDMLHGGEGDDTLEGSEGDDILHGGKGDDELEGGDGNDILYGGNGSDTLEGLMGVDTFYGGKGDDYFSYYGYHDDSVDIIYGGEGEDTFAFNALQAIDGEPTPPDVIKDFNLEEDEIRVTYSTYFFGDSPEDIYAHDGTIYLRNEEYTIPVFVIEKKGKPNNNRAKAIIDKRRFVLD